jgi:hypothetical protein
MTGREKALGVARDYLAACLTNDCTVELNVIQFDDEVVIGFAEAEGYYYFRCYENTKWGDREAVRGWLDNIQDQTIIYKFCNTFTHWDLNEFEIFEEVLGAIK